MTAVLVSRQQYLTRKLADSRRLLQCKATEVALSFRAVQNAVDASGPLLAFAMWFGSHSSVASAVVTKIALHFVSARSLTVAVWHYCLGQ